MVTEPTILDRRVTPPTAEVVIVIPLALKYLRGHFPGLPVVPGVVQIKWALDQGAACLGLGRNVRGIEALKFNRVIVPTDQVTLSLRFDDRTNKLHFSYDSIRGRHGSGRLVLEGLA